MQRTFPVTRRNCSSHTCLPDHMLDRPHMLRFCDALGSITHLCLVAGFAGFATRLPWPSSATRANPRCLRKFATRNKQTTLDGAKRPFQRQSVRAKTRSAARLPAASTRAPPAFLSQDTPGKRLSCFGQRTRGIGRCPRFSIQLGSGPHYQGGTLSQMAPTPIVRVPHCHKKQ